MTGGGGGGGWDLLAVERRLLRLLHERAARCRHLEVHAHLLRHYLVNSNLLFSALVSSSSVSYSLRLFHHHPSPSLLLFNSTLKSLSLSSSSLSSSTAFSLFSLLCSRSLSPDHLTFPPILKSSSFLSDPKPFLSLHALALLHGFHSYPSVSIAILENYTLFGPMSAAQRVFDEMPYKEIVAWNLMINGFCKRRDFGSGYRYFRQMGQRSVVSWNSMLAGLSRCGQDGEVLQLYEEMVESGGVEVDDATLATVLPVCARMGNLELGRWIHRYADRAGLLKKAVNVGNAIIDMYCKCGDMVSARSVFNSMARKSVVTWNSMIMGLAFNGHGHDGLTLFEEMKRSSQEPNAATFVGVLGCCTHAGLADIGRELFHSMHSEHGIEQRVEHYGCMVDLLGRCGLVKEAHELVRSMPARPSATIWGALLSACRSHGELGLAEVAIKELTELEPWNSGNYVLLANLYANAGRWEEAENARCLMKLKSVQKVPGQSLIESNGGWTELGQTTKKSISKTKDSLHNN